MKIDVAVCTYKSEKYLDQCLTSIEKAVPINRLIIVDHYSTDRTIEIAKKHNAVIYFENVGVGYARQIAVDHMETPIFLFVDSDVVFYDGKWFPKSISMVGEKTGVGGLGLWTPTNLPPWRRKYVDYWWSNTYWKNVPATRGYGFVNAYLILKKAVEGIRIPKSLGSNEHVYIKEYIEKGGWTTHVIMVNGMHFYDFPDEKAAWLGAGERVFYGLGRLPRLLAQKVLTAPFKAFPPAIAYNDVGVIVSNTRYWIKYLKGWLHHDRYLRMKR